MQHHVEEEPPNFQPLVGPVDEDAVDRDRARRVHTAHRHGVVREEP